MIYEAGKLIGQTETDSIFKNDAVAELIKVTIEGKQVTVLHVKDMNYGIIIPDHVATIMYDVCEDSNKGFGIKNWNEPIKKDEVNCGDCKYISLAEDVQLQIINSKIYRCNKHEVLMTHHMSNIKVLPNRIWPCLDCLGKDFKQR